LLTAQVRDAPRMESRPAAERLAVLTQVLIGVESGIWDGPLGEDGWLRMASTTLEALGAAEIPETLSTRVGSWAALAVDLMHAHLPTSGHPAEATWYEEAAGAVAYLLVDADEDLVAEFCGPFTNANGNPVDPDAVMHIVTLVVQGDPLWEAVDVLSRSRPGWR